LIATLVHSEQEEELPHLSIQSIFELPSIDPSTTMKLNELLHIRDHFLHDHDNNTPYQNIRCICEDCQEEFFVPPHKLDKYRRCRSCQIIYKEFQKR
jgi:hypothetical protein